MANSYLNKTFSGNGSTTKFTASFWVKRSKIGVTQEVIAKLLNGSNETTIRFKSDDTLNFVDYTGDSTLLGKTTNRKFRDTNAWYHIVCNIDTTQASADDRAKIYVNGVQETSFSANTVYSQNASTSWNNTWGTHIGWSGSDNYFDGYLSHVALVDGTALTPTSFGETDSTSGIWKFKSPSGVTWGTNGVHLKFENSGALGTDSSGNSNTFAVNGNLKQSLDTPSNVYATLNTLNLQTSSPPTIINGNNTISAITDNDNVATTLGGEFKWYYEAKVLVNPDTSNNLGVGVGACHIDAFNYAGWSAGNRSGFQNSDTKWYSNNLSSNGRFVEGAGTQVTVGLTQANAGAIIGVACDSANGRVYIHVNGVYQNSGDPVGGTGYIGGTTGKSGIWFPYFSPDGTNYGTVDVNFGNGLFGTTAITSAGSNGNGSLFEYDVPSGYYALNTKNINTYG